MSELLPALWAAQADVERLGAELHDRETTPERRQEIQRYLRRLYVILTNLQEQNKRQGG